MALALLMGDLQINRVSPGFGSQISSKIQMENMVFDRDDNGSAFCMDNFEGAPTMKRTWLTDLLWMLVLLLITASCHPYTRQIFIQLTNNHPYGMGFIKFAILASMGELLALRLAAGAWEKPGGFVFKVIVWGVIGVLITFMFSLYSAGVTAILQPATPPNGFLSALLIAFLTSATMNLTFGIVFMVLTGSAMPISN